MFLGQIAGGALAGLGQGMSSYYTAMMQNNFLLDYQRQGQANKLQTIGAQTAAQKELNEQLQKQKIEYAEKQLQLRGMNTPAALAASNSRAGLGTPGTSITSSGTYTNAGIQTLNDLYGGRFVNNNKTSQTNPTSESASVDTSQLPQVATQSTIPESETLDPLITDEDMADNPTITPYTHQPQRGTATVTQPPTTGTGMTLHQGTSNSVNYEQATDFDTPQYATTSHEREGRRELNITTPKTGIGPVGSSTA